MSMMQHRHHCCPHCFRNDDFIVVKEQAKEQTDEFCGGGIGKRSCQSDWTLGPKLHGGVSHPGPSLILAWIDPARNSFLFYR